MEKSARLISIKEFSIDNSIDNYLNNDKLGAGECKISMLVTTLTLVKKQV
jgi:hypothetical protein